MKKYTIKLLLIFTSILIISCNKNNNTDNVEGLNDPNTLKFNVVGYHDLDLQASNSVADNSLEYTKVIKKDGYSVSASFGEVKESSNVKENLKNKTLSAEKKATLPLNNTSLYRLVVYETNTKRLIADKIVKADTIGKVKVSRDVQYDWIAYTYNENNNINSSVITNASNVITSFKHDAIKNKPFMVAKGSSIINDNGSEDLQQQTVGILFKQKTARIRVKVDITSLKSNAYFVRGTIIPQQAKTYYGVYDFLNGSEGAYESHVAYTETHTLNIPSDQDLRVAYSEYQYTSKIDPIGDYTLKLRTEWRYKVPTGATPPSNASISDNPSDPEANNFDYKINSNLAFAKSYEFTLKVRLSDYVDFNGVYWARFNLRYDPSTDTYILRDNHDFPVGSFETRDTSTTNPTSTSGRGGYPGETYPATFKPSTNRIDYFRPGYYNITNDNSLNATKDPCSKVGDGKWRLPTKTDYENLIANSNVSRIGLFENVYIVKNGNNYITNDRINLFRYGRLNYNGNASNPVWTPYRVGYNYSFLFSSQVDDGEGMHLYKNGSTFGVFSTGFHVTDPSPTKPINRFIDAIPAGANFAYSVRCIRDVKY